MLYWINVYYTTDMNYLDDLNDLRCEQLVDPLAMMKTGHARE